MRTLTSQYHPVYISRFSYATVTKREKGPMDGKINGSQSAIFPSPLKRLNVVWLREDHLDKITPHLVAVKGMACAIIEYSDLHDLICASAMGFA